MENQPQKTVDFDHPQSINVETDLYELAFKYFSTYFKKGRGKHMADQTSSNIPAEFTGTSTAAQLQAANIVSNQPAQVVGPTKTEFVKWAKEAGYVKKPLIETEATRQFKVAWLTFLMLVIGDLLIFLGAAIDMQTGNWALTAILWRTLIMSILKDCSAALIGKILKYYNIQKEATE